MARAKVVRLRLIPNRFEGANDYAEYMWKKYGGCIGYVGHYSCLIEVGSPAAMGRWHVYPLAVDTKSPHHRSAGGILWKFAGDLKAFKRHYPKEYAERKAAGLLVPRKGRKLP